MWCSFPRRCAAGGQHRREQQERLGELPPGRPRTAIAPAAVQMGLHYFYGTGGVKKDRTRPLHGSAARNRTTLRPFTGWRCAMTTAPAWSVTRCGPLNCFRRAPSWAICRRCAIWACATKTGRERRRIWTGPSSVIAMRQRRATRRGSAIWGPCITSAWEWRRTMGRRPALHPSGGAAASTGAVPAGSVL